LLRADTTELKLKDYNREVLAALTVPNVRANSAACGGGVRYFSGGFFFSQAAAKQLD
jgi:hypothetical protein